MITAYKGKFHIVWYPKTASTDYALNDAVYILNTVAGVGTLALCTNSSTNVIGLVQKTVASTDSDYAVASLVPVLVGDEDSEYLFDVSTGTAAVTDIGEMVDFDDENSIDVSAYTKGQILITRFISTTQVVGKFNKGFGLEIPITQ
jgi:hypothetical protein